MATGIPALSAVVLAGGQSSRMGRDKAWLPHPETGEPMLLRQLALLASCAKTAPMVSARTGQDLPPLPPQTLRINDDGDSGPLCGLVQALKRTDRDHLAVIPVDLPNLSQAEIQKLQQHLGGIDEGVYAQTPDGPQPLVCIVPRTALPDLETALGKGELSIKQLFSGPLQARMKPVPFSDEEPFQNWNRPASSKG